MHIEMACPGCGRKLRVATEYAGKAARCPLCNTIYNVPDSASPQDDSSTVKQLWQLKTPEGQIYGPVTRELLDQWVSEGRISEECRLLCETDGIWQDAATVYPVLRPIPKKVVPQPVFDNPVMGTGQIPQLAGGGTGRVRIINAHRGGLVLALGILSWAFGCPVFGVMAWVMGSSDLRDMQRGVLDSRGMGLTQAGQIIGMIHAILSLIVIVFAVFALIAIQLLS